MDKYTTLKQYFGHTGFRAGQEELIDHILEGQDVLGIMPTGAGKSICYQIPALLMEGVTLVISPLISLMKDQVSALMQSGVRAAFINSSLTAIEYDAVFSLAKDGAYKLLYVAPERLMTPEFQQLVRALEVSMVTVDEAHCVSQWGQDFRPSYLKIVEFIETLPYRPVISAFTATATKEVREDIACILRLQTPFLMTTGFDRQNLSFSVLKPQDKFQALQCILNEKKGQCGIIYCATRKNVEEVCSKLQKSGIAATRYHAGLDEEERRANQEDFIYDRCLLMVATNAFGMGIDKSNVSFVVHYNMPKNLESYYQEAGRAGRDGEEAECILLYSGQDVRTNQFLIEISNDNPELTDEMRQAVQEKDYERLKAMTFYCSTTNCLREYILRYFGEAAPNYCGNCSNCNTNFETVDITVEAQKIVSCVYRLKQRYKSFGKMMIVDILHGSKNERIRRMGLETLSTYGIMREVPPHRIRTMLQFLIENDYLTLSKDGYSVVELTERSGEIVRDRKTIEMKLQKEEQPPAKTKQKIYPEVDQSLFAQLKELRTQLATEEHVPAYIIFTDAALRDMCAKLPVSENQFLAVSGVGRAKLEKYGARFTALIRQYIKTK